MSADLLKAARESWPKPFGLVLALCGSIALGPALSSFAPPLVVGITVCACSIGAILLWVSARRLRKCPSDKFGFVVAISVENDSTRPLFQRDFVDNLTASLKLGGLSDRIWVYQIPHYLLPKQLSLSEATELRNNIGAAFVLFGQVRTRGVDKLTHHVDLFGAVGHSQTLDSNKAKLVQEFSELLPRYVEAKQGEELVAFELSSVLSSLTAKYITGIAAFLSNNVDQAEALYADAEGIARQITTLPPAKKILERLPLRRSEIALHRANVIYRRWRDSRSEADLTALASILDNAPTAAHDFVQWRILQAIRLVGESGDDFSRIRKLVDQGDPKTRQGR